MVMTRAATANTSRQAALKRTRSSSGKRLKRTKLSLVKPPSSKQKAEEEVMRLRLHDLNMVEKMSAADGNCQFISLGDQLGKDHLVVRQEVAALLMANHDLDKYKQLASAGSMENMGQNGWWGDESSLQAAADLHGRYVMVANSEPKDLPVRIFAPQTLTDARPIWLSYWAAKKHYNSLIWSKADNVVDIKDAPPPPPLPRQEPAFPALTESPLIRYIVQTQQDTAKVAQQLAFGQQLIIFGAGVVIHPVQDAVFELFKQGATTLIRLLRNVIM